VSALALSWRLLRAGGRRGSATAVLAAAGSAVATALLVLVAGTWSGFDARADRVQWRAPQAVAEGATAVQRTTTTAVDGLPLVVVDLAATGDGAPPVPPGLTAFPAPGQTALSPALAALAAERPELAARFGTGTTELGRAALAFPDELVAVAGHAPGDAVMTAPAWRDQRRPDAYAGPAPVRSFTGAATRDGQAAQYSSLALVAAVLLVVPLLVLCGAAARLGLARRDSRLAALRLAGATPRQVLALTAVESGLPAAAGALVGVLVAAAALPLAARVPVGGGAWYAADLLPPAPVVVAVVLGVVVLAVGSAAVALRRVLRSPLGVAAAHAPRRMGLVRLGVFVALLAGFLRWSDTEGASTTGLVVAFAAVFGALAVVGPWVVGVLGRVVVARSRSAAALLAGRRLLDDPRGAWRVVGAVAMTGFVAGVLALFPTGGDDPLWGRADRLDVAVPAAGAEAVATDLRAALADAGIAAEVTGPGDERGALLALSAGEQGGEGARTLSVALTGPTSDLDAARTVVAQVAPASVAATGSDIMIDQARFSADFRTASVLVLAVSFAVAMASAATTSTAEVLDRRRTYRQLALVGVPLAVLDRARVLQTQLPLVLLAIGSTATGVVVAAPLTRLGISSSGLDASGLLLLLACLGAGLVGVRLASAASRPLLARVAADPASASE